VIQDQSMMNLFLKFLIANVRTKDGNKDSASNILYALNKQDEKKYMKDKKASFVSDYIKYSIKIANEHKIFRKVYVKYLMLRIRAKISYMAFAKRMTIVELFFTTILRSYSNL